MDPQRLKMVTKTKPRPRNGSDGFHRRMQHGRQQEDEAGFTQAVAAKIGGNNATGMPSASSTSAEAAAGGDGAIAVLGDSWPPLDCSPRPGRRLSRY